MTSFRRLAWLGVAAAALALGMGGGCTTREKLAVIPCTMQEHCTPHGLFCDTTVGQCALCTNDAGDCTPPAAGGTFNQGGSSNDGGSANPNGGSNPSGGDGSGGNGSGGDAGSGNPSGGDGSGGDAGSSTTGGSNGAGGSGPGTCSPVTGAANDLIIYSGAACDDKINPPRSGYWLAFNDTTGLQNPSADQAHNGVTNGRGGSGDCMMRTQGNGFTDWGGSVKMWINSAGGQICTYDATNYTGIRLYMRGSATGTSSGVNFDPDDNTVRVNIPTQSTAGSGQGGTCVPGVTPCDDSYGKWCDINVDWTLCDLPFSQIAQVGWGTVALFTKSEILGLQIQASRYPGAASVSWDIYIDDVTFY